MNMHTSSQDIPSRLHKLKVVGITDGDPFDKNTWSGSSAAFFGELNKLGILQAGISGLPSHFISRLFQIKNFCPSQEAWRFKYHIDAAYYRAYTRKVAHELAMIDGEYTHTLQVYSHYDVPSLVKGKNAVTCAYQDGNLASLLASPRGYPRISSRHITKSMEWEKKVFSGLDYIFTFSEWLRQSFIHDYAIDPGRIIVIGAGANIPIPSTNQKQDFDGKTILFVGIDFERKGGKVVLEAFKEVKKEIPKARLVIVGPQLVSLPDGVECLGFITKNTPEGLLKFKQAYMDASVFVMPSLYEPFGVVFLEAMAYGLPCIGADNCAMPEIIDHNKTGFLVPPGDSSSLSGKIIELLKDPLLARKMGENGYEKVTRYFTWNHVAERVVQYMQHKM